MVKGVRSVKMNKLLEEIETLEKMTKPNSSNKTKLFTSIKSKVNELLVAQGLLMDEFETIFSHLSAGSNMCKTTVSTEKSNYNLVIRRSPKTEVKDAVNSYLNITPTQQPTKPKQINRKKAKSNDN